MESGGKLKRLRKVLDQSPADHRPDRNLDELDNLGCDVVCGGEVPDMDDRSGFSGLDRGDGDPDGHVGEGSRSGSDNSLDELLSDGAEDFTKKKRKWKSIVAEGKTHGTSDLLLDVLSEDPDQFRKLEGGSDSETSRNSLDELLCDGDVNSAGEENKTKNVDDKSCLPDSHSEPPKKTTKKEIDEMHAESQRLLRETKSVAFEAAPVADVPISGILSKLRQRKIQLGWKSATNARETLAETSNGDAEEYRTNHSSPVTMIDDASTSEDEVDDMYTLDSAEASVESPVKRSNDVGQLGDDAKDLFSGSPNNIVTGSQENNSESADCRLHTFGSQDGAVGAEAFPVKPGVMALLDDEAEAEDEDLLHNSDDDEGDDGADLDIIDRAEDPEELACKNRRAELHRQWLEQQDAAQTDDILYRIQGASKPADYMETFLDAEDTGSQESSRREFSKVQVSKEAASVVTSALQGLEEKTQEYHDSSDDEETERIILRQQLLETAESQEQFMSPVDDDSSREVLSIIKKANVCTKKRPAQQGARASVCKAKSVFSNQSTSKFSSFKQSVHTTSKSFVFGRDNSSSLHGVSMVMDEQTTSINKENAVPKSSKQGGASLFSVLKQQQTERSMPAERIVMAEKISIFAKFTRSGGLVGSSKQMGRT